MTTAIASKSAGAEPVQARAGTGVLRYMSGFANEFATEALAGALPVGQNSPQKCPYGLYAEQFSGTAFTAPRHANRRSWLYRIRPAAVHRPFARIDNGRLSSDFGAVASPPNQLRWDPLPIPATPTDFVQAIVTMAGNGDPHAQAGCGIHLYAASSSMIDRAFYNADGEMLIVPQQGRLRFLTELGIIDAEPHEIVVIPRGVRFRAAEMDHSPLDVVAWHGNFAPYKYDLRRFNTVGSISYDHPDPSIFLVLQAQTATPGVDDIDFVIFPPRILAAQHTFRPPWFHRNIASEFMGLIHGVYDAKAEGFLPGGASLHNAMSGHGPDAETFTKASNADTSKPDYVKDTMAFMFETRCVIRPTRFALESAQLQAEYFQCWQGLAKHFDPGHL